MSSICTEIGCWKTQTCGHKVSLAATDDEEQCGFHGQCEHFFQHVGLGSEKVDKGTESLMFLAGMVFFNEETKEYEPVGEEEYNEQLRRKAMGKSIPYGKEHEDGPEGRPWEL